MMRAADLEVFAGPGDTVAQRMDAVIQARALEELVKRAKKHTDEALEDSVRQLADTAGGGGFTYRHEDWSAVLTDPKPKPKIDDAETFAEWYVDVGGEVRFVERVEVADHYLAVELVRDAGNVQWDDLLGCLKIVSETILPDDPFTPLVKDGTVKVTDAGVIDTSTGERVPGTAVSRDTPKLQVRPGSGRKDMAVRALARQLGLPAELTEGNQ